MRYSSMRVGMFIFLCLGGCVLFGSMAHAQFRAGVEGTVTDMSGAAVPRAQVTVTSQETGKVREAQTDAGGFYSVTNLAPGLYTVSVTLTGFKTKVLRDVDVSAEATKGLNISLAVGAVYQQVTVNASALPALQTEDASLTGNLSTAEVQSLPQYRGEPFEILRLIPGVFGQGAHDTNGNASNFPNYSGVGGSQRGIFQIENAVQVSANGSRVEANGYQLDGSSTMSQAFGGATVLTPNAESVKEIKVEVSPYSAEDNHGAGAIVQTVSQNGTNSFHGSLGLRNHSPGLNAFQRWNGPRGESPNRENLLIHNEFGSLGGPILKNRLFAFFSFEHLKQGSAGFRVSNFVETPQWVSKLPAGSLAARIFAVPGSGFTNPKILTAGSNCAAVGLTEGTNCATVPGGIDLGSNTGTPGTIVTSGTGGGLDGSPDLADVEYDSFPDQITATQYNGRIDYNVTAKDSVAFSIFREPQKKSFLPGGWVDGRQYDLFNTDIKKVTAALLWTRTLNASTVNEARANVTRWFFNEITSNPQAPFGVPIVNINIPQNSLQAGFPFGPGVFFQTTYTFRDTLSKVHGSHTLKFGGEVAKEQNNSATTWAARPTFDFNNLFSFANDAPIDEGTTFFNPKTGTPTDFRKYIRVVTLGLFAQDTWKVKPNLTLTLGLRYDYFTPLHDKFGRLSNIILGSGDNALTGAKIRTGGDFFQPDRHNFGPQLGVAWSPSSLLGHDFHNKFVLRGGVGLAYNRVQEALLLNAVGNPPDVLTTSIPNPSQVVYGFSAGGNNSFTGFPSNPATIETFDPNTGLPNGGPLLVKPDVKGPVQNLRTPRTWHYSVEGQYDVGRNWVVALGYQGNQSRKYPRDFNLALAVPPNPNINSVRIFQTDVNAHYNAFLARVTHRMSHGLEASFSYRLSRAVDSCSSDLNCNQTFPFDQRTEIGPSDFDVTHSITAFAVWELPILRNSHGWLHTLAGGWKVSPIFTFNSGFPWTPVVGTCVGNVFGNVCPTRPTAFLGKAGDDFSTDTFKRLGGNFQGFSTAPITCTGTSPVTCQTQNFTVVDSPVSSAVLPPAPGVGRNTFRGPRFTGDDISFSKSFTLPKVPLLGENVGLEFKANFFNALNKLNLNPFTFNSGSTNLGNFQTCSPINTCPAGAAIPPGGTTGTFFAPNQTFGGATGALAGRVIELYARFSF